MYEEHMMQGWAETGELLQKENEIKKTKQSKQTEQVCWKKSLVKEKSVKCYNFIQFLLFSYHPPTYSHPMID